MTKGKADLLIAFITLLYGASFVFIKVAIDAGLTPSFIVLCRGALFLALTLIFFGSSLKAITKRDFLIGTGAGLLNFAGYYFQTLGGGLTSPSNNAFLTGLNALLVPILSFAIYKQKPSVTAYIAVPIGVAGMFVLTGFNGFYNLGDLYSVICAVLFGALIAYLGHTAKNTDFKKLAFCMALWQVIGSGVLFAFDDFSFFASADWLPAIISLLFLGVLCSFFASTVQIFAQKYTSPTTTGLIMTLESLFAAVISIMMGFDVLTGALIGGGLLIVSAVLIQEVNIVKLLRKKSK